MAIYDDHKEHRDQFEIIALHDDSVKTLAEMDEKLIPIKKQYWQNRDLPFPILFDGNKDTIKRLEISHFPTGLLIDPTGKLVGEAPPMLLESKLPPLPAAKLWARNRDMMKNVAWSNLPTKGTLANVVKMLERFAGSKIEIDAEAVNKAGLKLDAPIPLIFLGTGISLRTQETLMFAPFGLGFVPSADGKSTRLTTKAPVNEPPSYLQKQGETEWTERLRRDANDEERKAGLKPLEFKSTPLVSVIMQLNQEYDLPLAVDARAIHEKRIDPNAVLTGKVGPGKLGEGLNALLKPVGLVAQVRGEIVFITPVK